MQANPPAVQVSGLILSVPLLKLLCALCCLSWARCPVGEVEAARPFHRPVALVSCRGAHPSLLPVGGDRADLAGWALPFHRRRFGGPRGPRAASGHGHFSYRSLSYRTVWASGHPPVLARPAGIEPAGQTVSRSCWPRRRELVDLALAFGLRLLRMTRFVPHRFGTFLYFVALDLLSNIMSPRRPWGAERSAATPGPAGGLWS